MSALRLEVETHIVTGVRDRGPEPVQVRRRGRRQDRRARASTRWPRPRRSCPRPRRSSASRSPTSAPARSTSRCSRTARRSTPRVLPVGGNNVTNDVAIGLKTSLQVAEELKIQHGTCDLRVGRRGRGDQRLGPRRGRRPDGQPARGLPDHRGADARDVRAAAQRDPAPAGVGMLPAGIILTGGAAQLAGAAELGREVLQMPVRVAAPAGIGGLVDTLLNPSYCDGRRAAPVGRRQPGGRRADCATSRRRRGAASAASATRSGASSRRRRRELHRSGPAIGPRAGRT